MTNDRRNAEAKEWLWLQVMNGRVMSRSDVECFTDGWDSREMARKMNQPSNSEPESSFAAADEIDRLRSLIQRQQHDDLCAVWERTGGTSDEGCTCWKADAL